MKRFISCGVAAIMMFCLLFTSMPAMAAGGTDIVETFESYFVKKDNIGMIWKADGDLKGNVSTDTKTSAPNRGDGKAKGNYRSLKATFDISKQGWGSFRNRTEDNYALIDPVNNNQDVYFTFYAKADKPMSIRAAVDIKDCPFYQDVQLTTEWKQYKLSLRDLTPQLKDKNGNLTKIYDRNKAQAWGSGKEEAFLVGFKFEILKDTNPNLSAGTFWLDTLAFDGIAERSEDNTQDKPGTVPADFTPDKPVTPDTKPDGGTSSNKPVTPDKTPSNNEGTTTSTTSDTTTESGVTSSDETTSTESDVSGDVSSTESSEDVSTTEGTTEKEEKSGMSTGAKIAIVVVVLAVLVAGGLAYYFFVFKKKNVDGSDKD